LKNGEFLKLNKFIVVSMVLLAIILMGAVNAAEDYDAAATEVAVDAGEIELDSLAVDEMDADGDVSSDTAVGTDVKQTEKAWRI
jgi:hypothetical protein